MGNLCLPKEHQESDVDKNATETIINDSKSGQLSIIDPELHLPDQSICVIYEEDIRAAYEKVINIG